MDRANVTIIRPSVPSIPGYLIKEKIGEGGMATVYLAIQESLDRTAALKIVAPSMTAIDPQSSERFLKEGRIVAHLNHPNIVTVYDIGKAQSFYYMAMEYISEGSLSDRLKADKTIQDPLGIIRQIAKALAYAHKSDVIHRDVKPANILFREDGSVVLSDFGIAKALSSHTNLTTTGFTAGTPEYMSPEQARGDSIDTRTDLYSLGIVFYEILARKKPFKGEDSFGTAMSHISAPIPYLPEQFSYYQPIIDRLLAKDPDDRYSNAEQLIKALDRHDVDVADGDAGEKTRLEVKTRIVKPGQGVNKRAALPGVNIAWVLRWSVLGVLLIGIMIGGYHWFSTPTIDPQTRWIINMMLENASRQLEASKLIEPVGDNAYKNYRDILELMPDNSSALRGLQIIAGRFEQQATEKQDQGLYEESLSILEKGLFVTPDNKDLLARKEELNSLIQDRIFQEKLTHLFAQAEIYAEESKYTEPAEGNAYMVYQEILRLDPDNKKALNGIHQIAEHYANSATSKQQEDRYEEGLNLVIKGLQIDPDNQSLLALKKDITGNIEAAEIQNKIADLYLTAEQQLSMSKYINPPGDNAFESYQKILIVDANNRKAVAGSNNVMLTALEEARKRKSAGDYEGALHLVDRALDLQPDNQEMLGIKTEINRLLETRQHHEQIQKMENMATKQIKEAKLLTPPGDNAYETYQNIKELDPANKKVHAGLNSIALRIVDLAKKDQQQGLLEESIKKLDQGLKVYPKNAAFINMRKAVAGQLEEKRVKQQLTELIDKAEQQIADAKYTSPAEDNAYETYMKIAALDPKNSHVKNGLSNIASYFEKSARQAEQEGRLAGAIDAVNKGLKVAPNNRSMVQQKSRIMTKLEDEARRVSTIKQMFVTADKQISTQQYVEPAGNNVLETYNKILLIEPGNSKALSGLSELRAHYFQSAFQKQQTGEYKDSLALISDGLEVNPEDGELLSLREEVVTQLDLQTRTNKISSLHTKADQQITDSRLTLPKGDNAYETYQKILEMDPGNDKAKSSLDYISMRYLQLGRENQTQGELSKGLAMTAEGLAAFPGNKKLTALKSELYQQIKIEEQTVLVANMLVKAERQVRDLRLTEPKGENAYETYKNVLALEPGNARAKDGINNIQESYRQQGQKYSASGDYRKGMEWVEEGLFFFPKNSALVKLKTQFSHELEAERQVGLLEGLFNQADQQLADKRLTQPKGNNALETYQKILEIAPGNSRAESGIGDIPKVYIQLGQQNQSSGLFGEGLALIQEGLDHYPDNNELLELKAGLEQQIREDERGRSLDDLLVKARKQIAATRLTLPKGDNAYETYLHVLELDPGNVRAKQGLNSIADRYETLAIARQKKGEFNRSLVNIDKGLTVNPHHPGLQKLKKQINSSMKSMSDKNRKVNSLLREAEDQYRASKLIQPVGSNARETYLDILAIDRGNKNAIDGLNRIVQHYKTIALRKQSEGDLKGSQRNAKNGLIVDPDNQSLRNLLNSIQNEIDGKNSATQKSRKIDKLLVQANRKLDNGLLIQPADNSAMDVYRKILALEPGNQEALNGINRISKELEKKARVKQNNGDLLQGLSIVDSGLRHIPGSTGLLSLRAELKQAIAAQQKKEQENKKSIPVFGTF